MIYVLIIMLSGGADGGRAIDATLHFKTLEQCQRAAATILKVTQARLLPANVACIERD